MLLWCQDLDFQNLMKALIFWWTLLLERHLYRYSVHSILSCLTPSLDLWASGCCKELHAFINVLCSLGLEKTCGMTNGPKLVVDVTQRSPVVRIFFKWQNSQSINLILLLTCHCPLSFYLWSRLSNFVSSRNVPSSQSHINPFWVSHCHGHFKCAFWIKVNAGFDHF